MQLLTGLSSALLAVSFAQRCWAQSATTYTDSATNITFSLIDPELEDGDGSFEFGMVLPQSALTTDTYDYIGFLRCAMNNGSAWCGVSHGAAGQMTNALLLMAWPYQQEVLTTFRYAEDYVMPSAYTGQANLTTLSSRVTPAPGNGSTFEIVYRCQNCLRWSQNGQAGNVSTSNGGSALGRAAAKLGPSNAGCPSDIGFGYHDNGFGQFTASFANATSANFAAWAALPAKPVTLASTCAGAAAGNATSTPRPTATSPATASGSAPRPTATSPATASGSASSSSPGNTISGGSRVGTAGLLTAMSAVAAVLMVVV